MVHAALFFGAKGEHIGQIASNERTGVGMRRVDHQARAIEMELLQDASRHHVGDRTGQPDQVRADDDDAPALAVFNGQRLGPQVVQLSFRRVRSIGVAGQVHGLLRRDNQSRQAGLVVGGAQGGCGEHCAQEPPARSGN